MYKGFHYITIADLASTIRQNFYKTPHDIDFVIGVPRSGMLPAVIIAEHLNVALIDVDSFIHGAKPTGGNRLHFRQWRAKPHPKVLVVDDTYFSGTAMKNTRSKLEPFKKEFEFIYCVAYREGMSVPQLDFWYGDVSDYTAKGFQCIYEYNFLNHYSHVMDLCIYDMDGLLCVDPPSDRNTEQYESYIKDATPLLCPTMPFGKICTYRISKYRDITQNWLQKHNIKCKELIMFDAQTREERDTSGIGPADFKANYFKNDPALLFVESDDWQARRIHELTGKQVLCTQTNKLYG